MKQNIDHLKISEKLEALSAVVSKVDDAKFNMRCWLYSRKPDVTLGELMSVDAHECGTWACALGAAALAFEGLVLHRQDRIGSGQHVILFEDAYGFASKGYPAAAKFFGITHREAVEIFSPWAYCQAPVPPKEAVVERIGVVAEQYRARGL